MAQANIKEMTRVADALELGALANSKLSDKALIAKARKQVAAMMKDPDSATFRTLHVGKHEGARYVCGEINAKNSMGGYVGFMKFLSDGAAATELDEGASDYFRMNLWAAGVPMASSKDWPNPALEYFCSPSKT